MYCSEMRDKLYCRKKAKGCKYRGKQLKGTDFIPCHNEPLQEKWRQLDFSEQIADSEFNNRYDNFDIQEIAEDMFDELMGYK